MMKTKRKSTKLASPAQLRARAAFAKMAKARAAAARKAKGAKRNSRGFSGAAPSWTKLKPKRTRKARAKNPLKFKSEAEYQKWKAKAGPAPRRKAAKKAGGFKRTAKAIGRNIVRGLGMAHNPEGQHLPGLPAKYQRMYEHVLDSTGSKSIAAATVHKELSRQNPGLFSRLFGKAKAKVGYRKTQRGRRKVAAVGYRKTQKGRKRPTSYMERMSYKRGAATYHLSKNPKIYPGTYVYPSSAAKYRGHKWLESGPWGKGSKAKKRAKGKRGVGGIRKWGTARLPNPSPASVFSEFRGKNATTKTKATAARGTPAVLAKLGSLQELHVRGKRLRFNGRASLAADGRKKLHIVGAKFARPNPPGEVDYGEILSVVYRADKPHIESGTYDYKHHFGEEGGRRPHLIVDEEGYPLIEGGDYKITADGVID